MNKQRKQEQKKKKRDIAVKEKLKHERDASNKEKSANNSLRRKLKKVKRVQRKLDEHSTFTDEQLIAVPEKVLSQIERNAEILRSLEDEYNKEVNAKKQINQDLEAKGLFTLEDKMKYLHEELAKEQNLM